MSDTRYTIIDAHVHTYQTRETGLQAKQGSSATDYGGTPDELLTVMESCGISKAVMVNMLPLADMRDAALASLPRTLTESQYKEAVKEIDARMLGRLERRNAWTCGLVTEHPNLIPFINLDPLMGEPAMTAEIANRVNNHGARGIKLHPASQRFFPNDRRLWPAYRSAQQLGLPVVYHAGIFSTNTRYSQPSNFVEVLESFPSLTVVMAHLGLGYYDEAVSLAETYANLQFDCSAVINRTEAGGGLSDADITVLIRKIGVERVMFGSDFPFFDPVTAVERFFKLDFSEQEKRLILADNAIRIYRLA